MQRAPVDRDEHVRADLDFARLGVRQRAVGAGGDDRGEARALGAETAHAQLQLDRDVALGAADEAGFEHSRSASSASRLAARMRSISPASLTARSRSTAAGAGDELPPVAEQLRQALVLLDGDARVVEAQAPALRRAQR